MGLLETKCKRRAVIGTKPEQATVIPDTIVYNAPRPIYGQVEWQGDFVSGVFYTMLDPRHSLAEDWDQRNAELDATVLMYLTEDEAVEKAKTHYIENYGEEQWQELKEIFDEPGELDKELRHQFFRLVDEGEIEI